MRRLVFAFVVLKPRRQIVLTSWPRFKSTPPTLANSAVRCKATFLLMLFIIYLGCGGLCVGSFFCGVIQGAFSSLARESLLFYLKLLVAVCLSVLCVSSSRCVGWSVVCDCGFYYCAYSEAKCIRTVGVHVNKTSG